MRYQWRRNGVAMAGATNTSITIVGVQTNDLASFTVVITDDVSVVESIPAGLYPLISPNFTEQAVAQSVVAGGRVTLSARANGWPPPFTFEWRLGALTLLTNIVDEPVSFFTFTAPTSGTVSYRTIVRNRALPSGRASLNVTITVLADADGDGIPDQWETAYGLTDPMADADGDKMLNWQEYQAGTNPNDTNSFLKIDSMGWSNGLLRLEFMAVSNRTYAVQQSGAVEGGNWQNFGHVVARATNRIAVVFDSPTTTNRYYRLLTPHP